MKIKLFENFNERPEPLIFYTKYKSLPGYKYDEEYAFVVDKESGFSEDQANWAVWGGYFKKEDGLNNLTNLDEEETGICCEEDALQLAYKMSIENEKI